MARTSYIESTQTRLRVDGVGDNENVTVPVGTVEAVRILFEELGLDALLDSLKRDQGAPVSDVMRALVSYNMITSGLSVNRFDAFIDDPRVREMYGLGAMSAKAVYRISDRVGDNCDLIVRHICSALKERFGVGYETVFMDWTSMYFESRTSDIVRFGYSRDHRSDRPQIVIGLTMDSGTGLPVGLTIMPGNIMDVTHFDRSFEQIRPFLDRGTMIVFDNGAYSKGNASKVTDAGFDFLTRLSLNKSDPARTRDEKAIWERVDDDIRCHRFIGNMGRSRYLFHSRKREEEVLIGYRRKAERDYDEMLRMRSALEDGRRPGKRYRNSNVFVDTRLLYMFPLQGMGREAAVNHAVRRQISGKEGYFMLVSSKGLTPSDALMKYRSRNAIEGAFRDLKHGVDWRPARCTKPEAIKGRVLISFLAQLVVSFMRFRCPDLKTMSSEIMISDLASFSVTAICKDGSIIKRIFSNFNRTIRAISGAFAPITGPNALKGRSFRGGSPS